MWVAMAGTEAAARVCKGHMARQDHLVRLMFVLFALNLGACSGWHCHFKCVHVCNFHLVLELQNELKIMDNFCFLPLQL